MRNYDKGRILQFIVYCLFTGDVSTTGVDLDRLQPSLSVFVGTVLQGSFAVIRADCHAALLVEDVVCWLGHIWEP